MKTRMLLLVMFCSVLIAPGLMAQVSNVTVNGSGTSFSMTCGDAISWHYNVSPAGATALLGIWLDVNQNGTIDPGTDVMWQTFAQTDGQSGGNNGPPDNDGLANGSISFSELVGLAPGKFIMRFSQGGVTLDVPGIISPLASPSHTISGTVTVPAGKSAEHIFVEARRDGQHTPNFWDAITDVNGNFSIEMNADTAGNPWYVSVPNNPLAPDFVNPSEHQVTIITDLTGIDFTITAAGAQVVGYVKYDDGTPLVAQDVFLMRSMGGGGTDVQYSGRSDPNGLFRVGAGITDLTPGTKWVLFAAIGNSQITSDYLAAEVLVPSFNAADSLVRNLTIYSVNSQISGTVHVNGGAPGYPIQIIAGNMDTASASVMCDAATGNFTIPVTDKISTYSVLAYNLPPNVSGSHVTAYPGNTGVELNLIMTGVKASDQSLPKEFSLLQNYPNPFNPTTTIGYDLPQRSPVTITIYNALGQCVRTIISGDVDAGHHEVRFDGTGLGSGIYFCRLNAGGFVQARKLLLLR